MVTGSTERGITSQGSVEWAASPYRALESSAFGGTKHCGAGFIHGILQARILEWVAISSSRRSS